MLYHLPFIIIVLVTVCCVSTTSFSSSPLLWSRPKLGQRRDGVDRRKSCSSLWLYARDCFHYKNFMLFCTTCDLSLIYFLLLLLHSFFLITFNIHHTKKPRPQRHQRLITFCRVGKLNFGEIYKLTSLSLSCSIFSRYEKKGVRVRKIGKYYVCFVLLRVLRGKFLKLFCR